MTDPIAQLRLRILQVAVKAKEGHVPSALSILDIVWALVPECFVGYPPKGRLILSKGHGCLALYAVLEDFGWLPTGELDKFCQPNGLLGHPERKPEWGIEATTGSLGHGLGISVGLAYGLRLSGSDSRVYCIVGDSELEEGSCWEAIMLAARFQLGNLTVIVDQNNTSPNGINGERYVSDLASKFVAFGWVVWQCNGHNHDDLRLAFSPYSGTNPLVVIAETVKGHGIPVLEQDPAAWHHRSPTQGEMDEWFPK